MWIELHDTVRDHPKILKLARRLGVPVVQAVGHMTSLWCWTLRMAADGALDSFDDEDIALASLWEGDAKLFIDAAVAVKLIDRTPHGYAVHDWMVYAGSLKSARRSQGYRARKRGELAQQHSNHAASRDGDEPERESTVISRRPTDQTDRPDQTTTTLQRHVTVEPPEILPAPTRGGGGLVDASGFQQVLADARLTVSPTATAYKRLREIAPTHDELADAVRRVRAEGRADIGDAGCFVLGIVARTRERVGREPGWMTATRDYLAETREPEGSR